MKQPKDLCPTATKKRTELGALILDLRNKKEVETFRFDVDNYINIPVDELNNRMEELPKESRIICVDNDPSVAFTAAQFLLNRGFDKVYYMRRSAEKWASKGFPILGNLSDSNKSDSCGCSH